MSLKRIGQGRNIRKIERFKEKRAWKYIQQKYIHHNMDIERVY